MSQFELRINPIDEWLNSLPIVHMLLNDKPVELQKCGQAH